ALSTIWQKNAESIPQTGILRGGCRLANCHFALTRTSGLLDGFDGARVGEEPQLKRRNGVNQFVEKAQRETQPFGAVKGRKAAREQTRRCLDAAYGHDLARVPLPQEE